MNTASQDLPRHLGALQEKLRHATEYEQAFYYFLEEFAGDTAFGREAEIARFRLTVGLAANPSIIRFI